MAGLKEKHTYLGLQTIKFCEHEHIKRVITQRGRPPI